MPYKRKYRKRSRPTKGKSLARRANWKASKALKLIRSDSEYLDISTSGASITNGGYFVEPMVMSQGTDGESRAGQFVTPTWFHLRAYFQWNSLQVSNPCYIRVLFVKQKLVEGSLPLLSEIFQNTGSQLAVSHRTLNLKKNFTVMMDKTFYLDEYHQCKFVSKMIKLRNPSPTAYSGNAGTVADIFQNNYFWLLLSDLSSNTPTCDYTARMQYHR